MPFTNIRMVIKGCSKKGRGRLDFERHTQGLPTQRHNPRNLCSTTRTSTVSTPLPSETGVHGAHSAADPNHMPGCILPSTSPVPVEHLSLSAHCQRADSTLFHNYFASLTGDPRKIPQKKPALALHGSRLYSHRHRSGKQAPRQDKDGTEFSAGPPGIRGPPRATNKEVVSNPPAATPSLFLSFARPCGHRHRRLRCLLLSIPSSPGS